AQRRKAARAAGRGQAGSPASSTAGGATTVGGAAAGAVQPGPFTQQSGGTTPAQASAAQSSPAQAGPAQAGPAQAGPAQAGPAQASAAQSSATPVEPSADIDFGDVPRNAPCPCGSGRKFKRCHGDPRNREQVR